MYHAENKKTATKTHSLRDGATLRGTTHIRPFGRPSAAITACSLTRKTAKLTPFGFAARGRPSPAASRALAPSAPSLCISRQILLPFIAIWIHYSPATGVCQHFSLFRALSLDKEIGRRYNNIALNPGVAQLVARLVRDQEAVGSSPVTRTNVIAVSREAAIFLLCIRPNTRPLLLHHRPQVTRTAP